MTEPPRMRRRVVTTIPETPRFAGNAPDMKAQEPVRVVQSGSYTAVLARNPPSRLARHGQGSSIRYFWALGLFEGDGFASDPDSPVYMVSLEQTPGREPMLCAFDRSGGHQNHGAEPDLVDEEAFAERAVELVRMEVGIDTEAGTGPR